MATTKDFLNYFLEQCGSEVTTRPMMGEYLVYFNGKLVGDICDNRVLLKPVNAAKQLLPNAEMQPPYAGAKPMLVLEDLDDKEFLTALFKAMYEELPAPKPKKKVQK
ncbi:MAG: TfoX/Sxy family protein [Clostridia bacterium]|nr:TfoX/Sxy family protein [Clostridia bacterium]